MGGVDVDKLYGEVGVARAGRGPERDDERARDLGVARERRGLVDQDVLARRKGLRVVREPEIQPPALVRRPLEHQVALGRYVSAQRWHRVARVEEIGCRGLLRRLEGRKRPAGVQVVWRVGSSGERPSGHNVYRQITATARR